MNTDDFFATVDAKLQKESQADTAVSKTAVKNREFLEKVIARLRPIGTAYQAKLKKRGIDAEVNNDEADMSITLHYKGGGYRKLHIGGERESYRIEFSTEFTSDDDTTYTATDRLSYDYSNWQDSIFEAKLQRLIDDFLLCANKHGGI
jgi:hypothetical protein